MRSDWFRSVLACGLVAAVAGLASGERLLAEPKVEQGAVAGAGAGAKYSKLLRQFPAPDDQKSYGDYYDYGYWAGAEWAGQKDLPPGYWVYIAPNWYIFGEARADGDAVDPVVHRDPRDWGPERATGAPDTPEAGDRATAWASLSPDGQREWLDLQYDKPVKAVAVLVYETFNPGAVDRVRVSSADGKQHHDWKGADPVAAGQDKGVAVIPIAAPFEVGRVLVELDSARVQGWNEIDAVGLLDEAGVTHWATSARASTTYAEQGEELKLIQLGGALEFQRR
jgi:hypothetical protein